MSTRKANRSTTPSRIAVLVLLGSLAAGCGAGGTEIAPQDRPASPTSPEERESPHSSSGDGSSETELAIEISSASDTAASSEEATEPATWELTCEPAGGDHPDPETACADLATAGTDPFEPVADDQVCTHIYGGPEQAEVTGHIGDSEVDARFSKANGCELDRWERLGAVLEP